MRLIAQTVLESSCTIDGSVYSSIGKGYMLLVGIGVGDDKAVVEKMAGKLAKLRIFEDEQGRINRNLADHGGEILSISQFTLYANTKKGARPSFSDAMAGEDAKALYEYFNDCLRNMGFVVKTGVFGADMKIALINDGPKTIIFDSKEF